MTAADKSTRSRVAQLTFDTSCVVSLLSRDNTSVDELAALHQIQEWDEKGKVRIWISEKSRTESQLNLQTASRAYGENIERVHKWINTLSRLAEYNVTQGVWILGMSKLGVDAVLASDAQAQDYSEMTRVVFPNKGLKECEKGDAFDIAILFEHYLQRNDLFVTRDKKSSIFKFQVKAELRKRWGIRVVDPIEAVVVLQYEYGIV